MSFILRKQLSRPRFSKSELIALVIALAGMLAWPPFVVPIVEVALVIVLHRAGFTWVSGFIIIFVVGVAVGLMVPIRFSGPLR